ncbi:diaminopropionate ammonia-lyase [Lysinibacillus antri]|uniref:Diaminopropionate ammonia-lyase n=1 Tax=Lysinibacillus antri TaxID=2498145 RepID=A0A432L888_9BACI|nr:diaminopropionate ammonia-lyase [Lysinibacillus antri]
MEKPVKWVKNRFKKDVLEESILADFNVDEIADVYNFQKTHSSFTRTPLNKLDALAEYLQVKEIFVKDESLRFGLNAFKVLGGIYAIAKYIANKINIPISELSFDKLKSEEVKSQLGDLTFISATDGNHGRGVAWAARELGYKSVIYMPKGSSEQRLQAIRNEGAVAEIQDVNYDETVRICAQLAEQNGWVMVQDTAWEGYEEIPLWIMQGYSGMAQEIVEQLKSYKSTPTHLFLQAGVGSFAAGIAGYFLQVYGEKAPKIVVVEPNQADCYYQSFSSLEGTREFVTGDMATEMAGLACGEPNTKAFELLRAYAIGSFSCDDLITGLGMRVYGNPLGNDARVISGESGAVTLGLVYYLKKFNPDKQIIDELGLDENSSIVLISTEGDTDEKNYRKIVWDGALSYTE